MVVGFFVRWRVGASPEPGGRTRLTVTDRWWPRATYSDVYQNAELSAVADALVDPRGFVPDDAFELADERSDDYLLVPARVRRRLRLALGSPAPVRA